MRGFRKAVETRLDQRIAKDFPGFEVRKYKDIPPVRSYCSRAGEALWFHMVPNIDFGRHWFTMELSYMMNQRSPIYARIGLPNDKPNEDGLRFTFTHLWLRHAKGWIMTTDESDFLWQDGNRRMRPAELDSWIASHQGLYPESVSDIERLTWPLVDELVDKLHGHAIPYFIRIASQMEIDWNCEVVHE